MWYNVKVPINIPIYYTAFRWSLLSPCSVPHPSTFLFGQNSCRIPAKSVTLSSPLSIKPTAKGNTLSFWTWSIKVLVRMGPWLATFSHGKPCVDRQDQLFHWRCINTEIAFHPWAAEKHSRLLTRRKEEANRSSMKSLRNERKLNLAYFLRSSCLCTKSLYTSECKDSCPTIAVKGMLLQ